MVSVNGQTQETSRRRNSSNSADQSKGLGRFPTPGRIDGAKSIRLNPVDSTEENSLGGKIEYGDDPSGKIVGRLKAIEYRYLGHLNKLKQRLEHELNEARGEEESFKTDIQELEREIYDLVSNQETLESPENHNK